MLCGVVGRYDSHLRFIDHVIGLRPGVKNYAAMNALLLPKRTVFICDTYVNYDPTAEQIAEMTMLAAEEIRRFGITPKVALLSHSSFGAADTPTAVKMRAGAGADRAARARASRSRARCRAMRRCRRKSASACFPNSRLKGEANLLVMPTLDAANIAFNLLKTAAGDGITVGPDPARRRARPCISSRRRATVRRIVNMTALTVVDAGAQRGEQQALL